MKKIEEIKTKSGKTQRCYDCVQYNCSDNINETCMRYYDSDILTTCLIRAGKECKNFEYGGGAA